VYSWDVMEPFTYFLMVRTNVEHCIFSFGDMVEMSLALVLPECCGWFTSSWLPMFEPTS